MGGSQSETAREFTHGFFRDGVKATRYVNKNTYKIRILPAIDYAKVAAQGWEAAQYDCLPYRDLDAQPDELTKTPGFTGWYLPVYGFSFFGNKNGTWLSGHTLSGGRTLNKQVPESGICPVTDCFSYIKAANDPELEDKYIRKHPNGRGFDEAILYRPKLHVLMNVLVQQQDLSWQNEIGIFMGSALDYLKEQMAMRPNRADRIISEAWRDYLYGDITHLSEGCSINVRNTRMESGGLQVSVSAPHVSMEKNTLNGYEPFPLDMTNPRHAEYVVGRYVLGCPDTVLDIWDYNRATNHLISDGSIEYNILREACEPHYDGVFPEQPMSQPASARVPGGMPSGSGGNNQPAPDTRSPFGHAPQPSTLSGQNQQPAETSQPAPQQPAASATGGNTSSAAAALSQGVGAGTPPDTSNLTPEQLANIAADPEGYKVWQDLSYSLRNNPSDVDPEILRSGVGYAQKFGMIV
jgi:hypothetical protein